MTAPSATKSARMGLFYFVLGLKQLKTAHSPSGNDCHRLRFSRLGPHRNIRESTIHECARSGGSAALHSFGLSRNRDIALAERAERQLRSNPYLALKNLTCEVQQGTLFLRGQLPTYYLKQVASAAVADLDGVERVVNQIEVVSSPRF